MTIIPHDQLEPETLAAVLEEFVTRQGAVHGHADETVESQMSMLLRRIRAGEAVIVYDEESESCTVVAKEELQSADPDQRQVVDE
jgi:uncharacterized protein YheU (UPF0270 family)